MWEFLSRSSGIFILWGFSGIFRYLGFFRAVFLSQRGGLFRYENLNPGLGVLWDLGIFISGSENFNSRIEDFLRSGDLYIYPGYREFFRFEVFSAIAIFLFLEFLRIGDFYTVDLRIPYCWLRIFGRFGHFHPGFRIFSNVFH